MKMKIKSNNLIEKLLNKKIGYCLFTVSNKYGFSKIALKKNLFKNNYKLIYFNEDVNALEVRDVDLDLSSLDENIITIRKIDTYEIVDTQFVIKNPSKQVEKESEIFRQIDRKAREEVITSKVDNYKQPFSYPVLQQYNI